MATKKSDMPPAGDAVQPEKPEPGSDEDLCPICLGPKVKPVVLGCNHSICSMCLEYLSYNSYYVADEGPIIRCPVCRARLCARRVPAHK